MKRKDIEVGIPYKVQTFTRAQTVRGFTASNRCVYLDGYPSPYPLSFVLMPWEAWEAKERERKERDAAVQAQRSVAMVNAGADLAVRLERLGITAYEFSCERQSVTLRWEDLARLLVRP